MINEKNIKANIWKYGLILVANKRIFVAIFGAYYLTIPGVTPQIIGTIMLVSSLTGFIFEIPSGYISDKLGHKQAIVASRILMILSTLFFLFASTIPFLMLGGIFLSASAAFLSGTGSAFMHDTLRYLKKEHEYSKIMGKLSAVGFAVPIVFMVLVPFLVSISYKVPFIISLVTDSLGLVASILLVAPPIPEEHIEEIRTTNFRQVVRDGYKLNYFSVAIFSGIISGTLFGIGGFRAPYQLLLEIPVIWFGVLFGIGRAGASLMLAYSGTLRKFTTMPSFYGFQMILFTVLILMLGTVSSPWIVAIVFIIMNAFNWGLTKIDEGYQLDVIKTSKFKATLLSTGSQVDQTFSAISSFGIGFMIEQTSYRYGFLSAGVIFLAVLLPLYAYIVQNYKAGKYNQINFVS